MNSKTLRHDVIMVAPVRKAWPRTQTFPLLDPSSSGTRATNKSNKTGLQPRARATPLWRN